MKLNVAISTDALNASANIRFDLTSTDNYMLGRVDETIEFILFASSDSNVQVLVTEMDGYKYVGSPTVFNIRKQSPYANVEYFVVEKGIMNVVFAHTKVYECISKLTELIRVECADRLKEGAVHEHDVA